MSLASITLTAFEANLLQGWFCWTASDVELLFGFEMKKKGTGQFFLLLVLVKWAYSEMSLLSLLLNSATIELNTEKEVEILLGV